MSIQWLTACLQSEIPEKWRAASLSKIEMPSEDMVCAVEFGICCAHVHPCRRGILYLVAITETRTSVSWMIQVVRSHFVIIDASFRELIVASFYVV